MPNPIASFAESDPRMKFAIDEARRTLRQFFDAYTARKENQTSFLLKVEFVHDDTSEHIWIADVDASVFPLEGTVANEPSIPGVRFMERVQFDPSRVTDWMYLEDGYLVGGFTTQVIRSSLTAAERAGYDARAPYKFRD